MSNTLTKDTLISSGSPPIAPIPGTAPHPAYCIDTPVTVMGYRYIAVEGHNPDGTGNGQFELIAIGPTPVTTIQHTCYDATAGTPSIPGDPGTPATVDLQAGWTGGAVSIGSIAAGGEYTFSVLGSVAGVVSGLNYTNEGTGYTEIDYGLYFTNEHFVVMEGGLIKTVPAPYVTADVFAVTRISDRVQYWQNNILIYTSLTVSRAGALYADASLYLAGDAILNAALSATVVAAHGADTGQVTGVLTALAGGAISGANSGRVEALLTALTGSAESTNTGQATGVLTRLTSTAFGGGVTTYCAGVLTGLTGRVESGLITPQFAVAKGELQQLSGFSYTSTVNTGSVSGTIRLDGFALSGTNAGFVSGRMTPLTGDSFDSAAVAPSMLGSWGARHFQGYGHLEQIYDPAGDPAPGYGMYGHAPAHTLRAYGGGTMRATRTHPTLRATGTLTQLGRLRKHHSSGTLRASGTLTALGSMRGSYSGRASIRAYGGGAFRGTWGTATMRASGLLGIVGRIRDTHALGSLTATGTLYNFGRVTGILPGLTVGISARMRAHAPGYRILATGRTSVTVTYEGYSITLIPSQDGVSTAATHYTNYPFDQILRWGDVYYGVAADGLYELGTDDYNGIPIVSEVTTALSDFGHPEFKRAVSLQLGGRVGADMNVSIVTAETDTNTYPYRPVDKRGARNHRVLFGKGVRARYWSYKFTNTAGEDFALDDMTPDVAVTRRNV